MKQLTNAQFHEFKTTNLFIGTLTGERLVRQDDDPKDKNKKAGDLMGYEFTDADGNLVWVGASSAIEQVIDNEKSPVAKDTILSIEFLGEGKTKAGRKFNRYSIFEFTSYEEAEAYHKKKSESKKEAF